MLQGKKTYLMSALAAVVVALWGAVQAGMLPSLEGLAPETWEAVLAALGFGGLACLRAGVSSDSKAAVLVACAGLLLCGGCAFKLDSFGVNVATIESEFSGAEMESGKVAPPPAPEPVPVIQPIGVAPFAPAEILAGPVQ